MCSLSPGSSVGRATGGCDEAAAGSATLVAALGRAGATLAAPGALPVLAAVRVALLARLGALGPPAASPCVLALAMVTALLASVVVSRMVNSVLAGLRITPRFGCAVCLPGVQTNCCRPFTGQTRH